MATASSARRLTRNSRNRTALRSAGSSGTRCGVSSSLPSSSSGKYTVGGRSVIFLFAVALIKARFARSLISPFA